VETPSTIPAADSVEERFLGWRRWRWPILAFVVAAQIGAILLFPVKASPGDLASDLAAGRVRSVDVGSFEHDLRVGYGLRLYTANQDLTSKIAVRWVTSSGLCYQTDLRSLTSDTTGVAVDPDTLDVAATIRATARTSGVPTPKIMPGTSLLELLVTGAAVASWALAVLLLVAGPEPRRFTRWGTFWLLCLPGGVGIIWWLLREAPWNEQISAIPPLPRGQRGQRADGPGQHAGGPGRHGGLYGLIVLLVLFGIVNAGLALGLSTVTNHHPGPAGVWQLVDRE
jgi:hypothetical protein